jgi:hypothetical protein
MTKTNRTFTDAPQFFRCRATVTLRDKSSAQCGRWFNKAYDQHGPLGGLCTQHAEMVHKGKKVRQQYTTRGKLSRQVGSAGLGLVFGLVLICVVMFACASPKQEGTSQVLHRQILRVSQQCDAHTRCGVVDRGVFERVFIFDVNVNEDGDFISKNLIYLLRADAERVGKASRSSSDSYHRSLSKVAVWNHRTAVVEIMWRSEMSSDVAFGLQCWGMAGVVQRGENSKGNKLTIKRTVNSDVVESAVQQEWTLRGRELRGGDVSAFLGGVSSLVRHEASPEHKSDLQHANNSADDNEKAGEIAVTFRNRYFALAVFGFALNLFGVWLSWRGKRITGVCVLLLSTVFILSAFGAIWLGSIRAWWLSWL